MVHQYIIIDRPRKRAAVLVLQGRDQQKPVLPLSTAIAPSCNLNQTVQRCEIVKYPVEIQIDPGLHHLSGDEVMRFPLPLQVLDEVQRLFAVSRRYSATEHEDRRIAKKRFKQLISRSGRTARIEHQHPGRL